MQREVDEIIAHYAGRPTFVVGIRKMHLKQPFYVDIPQHIWRALPNKNLALDVFYNAMFWPTDYVFSPRKKYFRFKDFIEHYNLEEGDKLVFAITDQEEGGFTMDVKIVVRHDD